MQTANFATPLSATQECRLVEYLEGQFLELTRGYKKRLIPPDFLDFLPRAHIPSLFILQGQVTSIE